MENQIIPCAQETGWWVGNGKRELIRLYCDFVIVVYYIVLVAVWRMGLHMLERKNQLGECGINTNGYDLE